MPAAEMLVLSHEILMS